MEKLLNDLAAATENYKAANLRAADARREETDAVNKLNDAQKAVDVAMVEMQSKAPVGSNWHSSFTSDRRFGVGPAED